MNAPLPHPDWITRAGAALEVLATQRELHAQIASDVDAFFAANPRHERTPENEHWITILVFERLTAATPQQQQAGAK